VLGEGRGGEGRAGMSAAAAPYRFQARTGSVDWDAVQDVNLVGFSAGAYDDADLEDLEDLGKELVTCAVPDVAHEGVPRLIQVLQAALEWADHELAETTAEADQAQSELDKAKRALAAAGRGGGGGVDAGAPSAARYAEMEAELEKELATRTKLEDDLRELQASMDYERQTVERLETTLGEERNQANIDRERLKQLEEENRELRENLNQFKRSQDAQEKEGRTDAARVDRANRRSEQLVAEIGMLTKRLGEVQERADSLEDELNEASATLVKLDEDAGSRDERYQVMEADLSDTERRLGYELARSEQLEKQLEEATKMVEAGRMALEQEKAQFEARLEEKTQEIEIQSMQIADMASQMSGGASSGGTPRAGAGDAGDGGAFNLGQQVQNMQNLRQRIAEFADKEEMFWEAYEQLEEDAREQVREANLKRTSEVERLRKRIDAKDEQIRNEQTKCSELDENLSEAHAERDEAVSRLAQYEAGIFGLKDAMLEIGELKRDRKVIQDRLKDAVRMVNEREEHVEVLIEKCRAFRIRAGLPESEDIDVGPYRLKNRIEAEKLKAYTTQLERDVQDLEEERLELKARLRMHAMDRGAEAVKLGLTAEQLDLVQDYADKLRFGEKLSIGELTRIDTEARSETLRARLKEAMAENSRLSDEVTALRAQASLMERGLVLGGGDAKGSPRAADGEADGSSKGSQLVPAGGGGGASEESLAMMEQILRETKGELTSVRAAGDAHRVDAAVKGAELDGKLALVSQLQQNQAVLLRYLVLFQGHVLAYEKAFDGVPASGGSLARGDVPTTPGTPSGKRGQQRKAALASEQAASSSSGPVVRRPDLPSLAGIDFRKLLDAAPGDVDLSALIAGFAGGGGSSSYATSPRTPAKGGSFSADAAPGTPRQPGSNNAIDNMMLMDRAQAEDVHGLNQQLIDLLHELAIREQEGEGLRAELQQMKNTFRHVLDQRTVAYRDLIMTRMRAQESIAVVERARDAAVADAEDKARALAILERELPVIATGNSDALQARLLRQTRQCTVLEVKCLRLARQLASTSQAEQDIRRQSMAMAREGGDLERSLTTRIGYMERIAAEAFHRWELAEEDLRGSVPQKDHTDLQKKFGSLQESHRALMSRATDTAAALAESDGMRHAKEDAERKLAQAKEKIEMLQEKLDVTNKALKTQVKQMGGGSDVQELLAQLADLRVSESSAKRRAELHEREVEMNTKMRKDLERHVQQLERDGAEHATKLYHAQRSESKLLMQVNQMVPLSKHNADMAAARELHRKMTSLEAALARARDVAAVAEDQVADMLAWRDSQGKEVEGLRDSIRDMEKGGDLEAALGRAHEDAARAKAAEIMEQRKVEKLRVQLAKLQGDYYRVRQRLEEEEALLFVAQTEGRRKERDYQRVISQLQSDMNSRVPPEKAERWSKQLLELQQRYEESEDSGDEARERVASLEDEVEGLKEKIRLLGDFDSETRRKGVSEVHKEYLDVSERLLKSTLAEKRACRAEAKLLQKVRFLEKQDKEWEAKIEAVEEDAVRSRRVLEARVEEESLRANELEQRAQDLKRLTLRNGTEQADEFYGVSPESRDATVSKASLEKLVEETGKRQVEIGKLRRSVAELETELDRARESEASLRRELDDSNAAVKDAESRLQEVMRVGRQGVGGEDGGVAQAMLAEQHVFEGTDAAFKRMQEAANATIERLSHLVESKGADLEELRKQLYETRRTDLEQRKSDSKVIEDLLDRLQKYGDKQVAAYRAELESTGNLRNIKVGDPALSRFARELEENENRAKENALKTQNANSQVEVLKRKLEDKSDELRKANMLLNEANAKRPSQVLQTAVAKLKNQLREKDRHISDHRETINQLKYDLEGAMRQAAVSNIDARTDSSVRTLERKVMKLEAEVASERRRANEAVKAIPEALRKRFPLHADQAVNRPRNQAERESIEPPVPSSSTTMHTDGGAEEALRAAIAKNKSLERALKAAEDGSGARANAKAIERYERTARLMKDQLAEGEKRLFAVTKDVAARDRELADLKKDIKRERVMAQQRLDEMERIRADRDRLLGGVAAGTVQESPSLSAEQSSVSSASAFFDPAREKLQKQVDQLRLRLGDKQRDVGILEADIAQYKLTVAKLEAESGVMLKRLRAKPDRPHTATRSEEALALKSLSESLRLAEQDAISLKRDVLVAKEHEVSVLRDEIENFRSGRVYIGELSPSSPDMVAQAARMIAEAGVTRELEFERGQNAALNARLTRQLEALEGQLEKWSAQQQQGSTAKPSTKEVQLKSELDELRKSADALRRENDQLRRTSTSSSKYMEIVNRNKELRAKIARLEEGLETSSNASVSSGSDAFGSGSLSGSAQRAAQLEVKVAALHDKLRNERMASDKVKSALEASKASVLVLEQELSRAHARADALGKSQDVNVLRTRRMLEDGVSQLEKKVDTQRKELERKSRLVEELQTQLAARENSVQSLKLHLSTRDRELDVLQGVRQPAGLFDELLSEVRILRSRVKELEAADSGGSQGHGIRVQSGSGFGLDSPPGAGSSRGRTSQESESQFLGASEEVERLRREHADMKRELDTFDDRFFAEIEELKQSHFEISQTCLGYESKLLDWAGKLGERFVPKYLSA